MNVKKIALATVVATTLGGVSSLAQAACSNDVWNKVMSRGKIVFRNTDGEIVGMEIDVAQAAADAMGVELETVAVQSSNRMQFLEQGKIDMMIATMSDRADRREIVGITQPVSKALSTTKWLLSVMALTWWLSQETQKPSKPYVTRSVWPGFMMTRPSDRIFHRVNSKILKCRYRLKTITHGHWLFHYFMSGLTFNLHQSGQLIELEKKWGIQPTAYLADKKEAYSDWLAE